VLIIEPARVPSPGSEDEFLVLREVLISIRKIKLRSLEIYIDGLDEKNLISMPQMIQDSYLSTYLESPEARALKSEFDSVLEKINEITVDPNSILDIPIIGVDRAAFSLFEGVYDDQQVILSTLNEKGQEFWDRPFMDIYKQLKGMPVLEGASSPEAVPGLMPEVALPLVVQDSLTGMNLDSLISEVPKLLDLLPKGRSVLHVLTEDMLKVRNMILTQVKDAVLANAVVMYIDFWIDSGFEFNLLEV